jgi:hypothetical protein
MRRHQVVAAVANSKRQAGRRLRPVQVSPGTRPKFCGENGRVRWAVLAGPSRHPAFGTDHAS